MFDDPGENDNPKSTSKSGSRSNKSGNNGVAGFAGNILTAAALAFGSGSDRKNSSSGSDSGGNGNKVMGKLNPDDTPKVTDPKDRVFRNIGDYLQGIAGGKKSETLPSKSLNNSDALVASIDDSAVRINIIGDSENATDRKSVV